MRRVYTGDRKESRRQSTAAYRQANPDRSRAQWREYKKRKTEKLAGRPRPIACEICGAGGRICFDHDHATGKFRGWLCIHCNLILGKANDSPALLRKLADYLEGGADPLGMSLAPDDAAA